MFSGGKRLECELEVKPRGHRNDDCIHSRVFERGSVSREVRASEIQPAILLGLLPIATCVAADHSVAELFQMSAVDSGYEAAAKKRDV